MRSFPAFFGLAPLLLAGCVGATADTLAREAARATVTPLLQARFPGVPVAPISDCVISNASASEIVTLATAATTSDTSAAAPVLSGILQRQDTILCVARAAPAILL